MHISLSNLILLLLFIATIAGCAGMEPGEPIGAGADDEAKGPGLFTGESGSFSIYDSDTSGQNNSEDLDRKLEKLEQLQKELEQLKSELEKQKFED